MLRIAAAMLIGLTLMLQGCVSTPTSGLQSYADQYGGFEFMYPLGWTEVEVPGAADVVFHDIIHDTENVSVVSSEVPEGTSLEDLGSPTEVGYKLSKGINAAAADDRDVELLSAQRLDTADGKTYYILEYIAKLATGDRHNLASAIIRRGQLFTFNASTREDRWEKVKDLMKKSVASFSVY